MIFDGPMVQHDCCWSKSDFVKVYYQGTTLQESAVELYWYNFLPIMPKLRIADNWNCFTEV